MRRWCASSAVGEVVLAGGLERRLEHGGATGAGGPGRVARAVTVAVAVAVAVAVRAVTGSACATSAGLRRRRRRGALAAAARAPRARASASATPSRAGCASSSSSAAPAAASQSTIRGVAAGVAGRARSTSSAVDGEQPDQVVELRDARAPRHVGGHRAGAAAAQDVLDERRHVAARPGLHEDPRAVRRTAPRSSRGTRPGSSSARRAARGSPPRRPGSGDAVVHE